MQFQSFSLKHKKMLVNSNVFNTNSTDILVKGTLTAELFLLIENLAAFSNSQEREYLFSIDKINSICGLSFTDKNFRRFMREACDLTVTIDTEFKKGIAPMIDEIKMLNNGSISFKINESFDFLRRNGAFKNLHSELPFKYNTIPSQHPEIGQQIMLIA
ncbi:hypothetical protein [Acinetobacter gandensis]|uniref:hypothetical protein n=1 Tax=Acinetobacter gandensis TaxID=1443941 RepID=UPI003989DB79